MSELCSEALANREVASALVVVEAKNAAAAGSYQRFGFIALKDNTRKLLLPMATVAAAW